MKLFFKNPFDDIELEVFKSEFDRIKLTVAIGFISLALITVSYAWLDKEELESNLGPSFILLVSLWLLSYIVYQLLVMWRIRWFQQKGWRLPFLLKLGTTVVEISFPSLLLFYMIDVRHKLVFIDSPIATLYFLILILSTLHLDFRLSFIAALVASLEYSGIIYYGFHVKQLDVFTTSIPESTFYFRCIVLIFCGAAAGLVAEDIKRRVKNSLDIQKSKNDIELIFGQQVSREVVKALVEDRDTVRKTEATMLALDIRNFSSFAEKHSPDEIMEFQNKIFGPILDIINQHQGVVNQIMGDGIMATFGTPVVSFVHSNMAYHAALKILSTVRELSEQGVIPDTRLGMGIHTGDVITGNIGNENRKQYSISGTAVIIAFRLEQLNKDLGTELLITDSVRQRIVTENETITSMGQKQLKGLDTAVEVYKVEALESVAYTL